MYYVNWTFRHTWNQTSTALEMFSGAPPLVEMTRVFRQQLYCGKDEETARNHFNMLISDKDVISIMVIKEHEDGQQEIILRHNVIGGVN